MRRSYPVWFRLGRVRQEQAELQAELDAGPKTPEGKPDTARINEIRKELAALSGKSEKGWRITTPREGELSKAYRTVSEAEEAAARARLDPKDIMRQTFKNSAERADVIAGVTSDEVGTLLKPPQRLTVDHIVSIKQISEMNGFEKLTISERNYLATWKENLIVMDSSANFSKGERPWSAWRQAGSFYDEASRTKIIGKATDLQHQIESWIAEKVKGR
jgi:hypothetical protein